MRSPSDGYLDPADVEDLIALAGLHLRDRNLLLSALAAPLPVFGQDVYLGLSDKAAALFIAINCDHPLSDCNAFVRSVADHRIDRKAIVDWIETHSARL